ncbi:DUF2490 domain-containing protein [Erythrobacter insulae]|uniref:DUF2490 domain-containing protein n=1 Tax=Erythrobacter insulae TaxID=2584124 RepID=A0A547PDM9_9SPHN|nr:DUF2490 domain-containing protein [Erythrobacter insulae]TRD12225.1 DUF2490 domain-containing protein [Erythrobacter insulae]
MQRILLFAAAIAAVFASPAAATEDDFNVWGGQFIFVDLDKDGDWFVRAEAQERFTQDADRLGQLLLRSFVGYRLNETATVGGGYAYILTDPVGPAQINEHRIYQEVTLTLINTEDGVKLTSRNRFEQRFFEEDGETGLRYRNQVQLTAPISEKTNLVLYTEPFIGVNETRFNRGGVALWRNFAGVSFPVAKGVSFTPGYLNQYVVRSGEDRMDHVANFGVTARF